MKKRILSFLLLCICTLAVYSAQVTYLTEGFESGTIPATWSQQVMSDDTCYWIIDTLNTYPNGAHSGSGRAVLRNTTGTTHGYVTRLITPALSLPTGANYQVSFAYAQAQYSTWNDVLKVYYSTDGSTWTLLEDYETYQNQWQVVTIDLIGAAGSTYYLAFEANDHDGHGVVLDDVKVFKKSDCADVQNFGALAGSSKATVFYQKDVGSTAQLLVDTVAHDMSTFVPSASNVLYYGETTNDQTVVTGLDAQRTYYAYIRTVCDDNESGYTNWVSASFVTSVAFPFSESFVDGIPSNWENLCGAIGTEPVVNPTGSTYSLYKWLPSTSTIPLSAKHVYATPYYNYSTGYAPAWLVSPAIDLTDVDADAIELKFQLAMTSSSTGSSEVSSKSDYRFHVLVSSDGETWTGAAQTTYEGTDLSAIARKIRLDLTGYKDNVIKVALLADGSGTAAYFHVANLSIDAYDVQCGGVSKVFFTNILDQSAEANWTVSGKDNVIVELSKSSTFATLISSDTIAPADHKHAFSGLESGTTYYVRVQQVCEDADWLTTSFSTAIGLDYPNKFTSSAWPSDWKRYSGVTADSVFNGGSLGTATTSGWTMTSISNNAAFGTYAAKFELYGTYKYWMVSPAIYLNPASATNVRLSVTRAITAYSYSSGLSTTDPTFTDTDDQYVIMVSDDAGATWKRSNAIIWDCQDGTTGYLEHHDLRTVTAEPEIVTMDLTSMIGKTIQVAIYAGSTSGSYSSGSDNNVYAGNITVKAFDPNCAGVSNITLNAGINDIKAKWSYNGTAAAIAELATNNTFTEGLVSDTIAPADSVVFSGLTANTQYYFRVMQNCEMGEWSDVKSVKTHCEADTIPYQYGFEDAAAAATPSCWTLIQDADGYPQVASSTSYVRTGSKYLSWGTGYKSTAGITYASLPAFTKAVNELEMSFYIRAYSAYTVDTLEVGVMTNPEDGSTFEKIATIATASTTYAQQIISFANYTGAGQYIAFKRLNSKKYPMYVDDIDVHNLPACYRMGEVEVVSPTPHGATVKFDQTNADNYQVVITTVAINPDTLAQVADSVIAYNQELAYQAALVISDNALQPNTSYYVYVRGVCSADEKGAWSAAVSLTTSCDAVDPTTYGTETFDKAANMSCWTTGFVTKGSSTSSATAGRTSATKYGAYLELAKKSVNSSSYSYNDGAYAITPELNIDSVSHYQVSFSAATTDNSATNVARLEVGVVTNPDDMDTYEAIKKISLSYAADSTAEKTYVVDFKNYAGDIYGSYGKYIMFKSAAGTDSTNYVLIDNVSFQVASACPQIIETSVDTIGLTSAVFHFENNGAAKYEVLVSTVNTRAVDTLTTVTSRNYVTTNRAELTGLNASTQYYAYVRAICGEGDTASWSASTSFTTKFGLPYLDQFTGAAFNGWSVYSSSNFSSVDSILTSSFADPKSYTWSLVSSSSSSIISGLDGNVARSYIYYYNNYNSWLVSPAIDMTPNAGQNIQLSFKAARSTVSYGSESAPGTINGYKLYVVVSTDDGATWKKVDATSWLTDGTGDYSYNDIAATAKEYKIGLSNYAGKTIRLAFYTESNSSPSSNNYLYVDDVNIYTYEAVCQGIQKLNVAASGTTAKATWEIEGTPAKTIIELSTASDFATVLSSDTLTDVFEKEFTGLSLNSTYYVRAKQADCENAEWTVKSVSTPLGIPYSQTFEGSTSIPSDWGNYTGDIMAGDKLTTASRWSITSSYAATSNAATTNIYSSNKAVLASPVLMLAGDGVSPIELSFELAYTAYHKTTAPTATAGQKVGVLVSEDNGATWNTIMLFDTAATAYAKIDAIPTTLTKYTYDLTAYAGKSVMVAFEAYSTTSSTDNDLYVDNFSIKQIMADCDDPTDLAVDSTDAHTAVVSWKGDSAKVSVVEYATSADFTTNLLRDTVAAGLKDTLLNLTPATTYYVRVQQICSAEAKTSYSSVANFLTACAALTIAKDAPYVMNFDNETAGTGTAPACWTINRAGGSYPYIYNYSYYANSGSNMLYFGGSSGVNKTQYVILPEVTNDAKELQLNFFIKGYSSSSNDSIYVGVMTDPEDVSTFVPVQGFQATSTSYEEKEAWLNNYTGAGHYVALKRVPVAYESYYSTYYYGSYIDDVTLAKLPSCYKIEDLQASALSHSAVVSHKAGNAGQYELIVSTKVINPDTVATVADSIIAYHQTVTDTATTVSSLNADSKYYVYLRGVCGEDDKSEWASTNFSTKCEALTISATSPYEMDFETESVGAIPACWSAIKNGSSYPQVYTGTTSYPAHQGTKCLSYGNLSGDKTITYTLLPEFTNSINTLQMNFYVAPYSAYYLDSLVIGVMSDPNDTTTFVAVKGIKPSVADYAEQEIFFNTYAGAGHYIAIKRASNVAYGSRIDDVTVSIIPACSSLASVSALNVSRREMDIVWSAKMANEGQHYDVVISKTALDDAALELAVKQDVDTTYYHASGLDRETTYYIYVRTNCGAEDGTGAWISTTAKTQGLSGSDVVEVAPEKGTSSNYMPIASYYHNSYTQAIFTPADLANYGAGEITTLAYNYYMSTSTVRNITVYMANTTADNVSSDYVRDAELVEVYSAKNTEFNNENDNWYTLNLDVPFQYTGGNLLVAVYMNYDAAETSYSSSYRFYTHSATNQARYTISDTKTAGSIALTNGLPTGTGSSSSYRPNMQFGFQYAVEACPAVDSIGHELIGEGTESARINWRSATGDYANSYDVLISDTAVVDFASVVPTADSIAALSYEATGLNAYTDYYVYVRVNCDAEGQKDGRSGWSDAYTFKTNSACRVVTDLKFTPTGKTSAFATWNATSQDNNFQYILSEVALSKAEQEVAIPNGISLVDTFLNFVGMTSGKKYYLYVANSCGAEGVSPYVVDSLQMPDVCPAVANLKTNYVAFNAVGVEWGRGQFGEENEWLVGVQGQNRDQVTTDSSYVFIGLEADSTYTFFVQAVCGEGDSSKVETLTVHTPVRPSGEATIGEGTATSSYAPVYGLYCDNKQKSQSIYPDSMLASMQGSTINGLIYYIYSGASTNWENAQFNVRMGITSQSNLSSQFVTETLTDVYAGTLQVVDSMMQINFNTPYVYEGGNLVIEFELPTATGYTNCAFKGLTLAKASRYKYGDYSSATSGTAIDFLPKVKFLSESATCNKVAQLEAKNITTTSADITWFPGDVETEWVVYNSDSALTAAALDSLAKDTVTVLKKSYTGLTADWDYHFYIRSLCSATEASAWKELVYQTAPTCFVPTDLTADSLASDAARVVWMENNVGFGGNYTVAYGQKNNFNLAVDSTYSTVSATYASALLTGLKANTEYSFAVRSNCGEGDLSRWSAVANFRTECGAETITKTYSYVMNFDAVTDSMPDCWSTIKNGGAYPYVYDYSYYANSGSKFLSFGGYSGVNKVSYAVLPAMSNDIDSLRIKFWMRSYYSSYTSDSILVGVMTDPEDASTFVKVAGFQDNTATYAEYEVSFAEYTGDGHYIAFKRVPVASSSSSYASYYGSYIDDVTVSLLPTCAKPVSVNAEAMIDTAVVNWVGTSGSYIVELSEGTSFASVDTLTASDTTIVLSGLKPNTTYAVRVTGVCDDANSEVSAVVSFTTKQGLPFSENFDTNSSISSSWTKLTGDLFTDPTTSSYYGWKVATTTGGGMGANHAYCDVALEEGDGYWYDDEYEMYALVTPEIMVNAADSGMVQLGFDLALTTTNGTSAPASAITKGRAFYVAVSTDGGSSWSMSNSYSWKDNGTMGTYESIPATATHYEIDLSKYIGKSIKIAFFHTDGTSDSTAVTRMHLDNVLLTEVNPNCLGIKDLKVDNVSFSGAMVNFGYKAGSTNAVIVLSKNAVLNLDDVILKDTILNDSVYTLPSLDVATEYFVFVEQLCDDDETSAWTSASFKTAYGVRYAPVFSTTTLSDEWKRYRGVAQNVFDGTATLEEYSGGWSIAAADTASLNYNHLRSEIWSTYNYWIATPAIDLTPNVGDGLLLSFDAALTPYSSTYRDKLYTGTDDKFMVVVSEDGGATWTKADATIWANDSTGDYVLNDIPEHGKKFTLDMSRYAGKVIKIAFHQESSTSNTDNYIHVGNIVLDKVDAITYEGDVCQGEDYDGISEGNPFYVSSSEYKLGLNVYSKYYPADTTIAGTKDTIYVLNLMVNAPATYEYYQTVCEGEHYVDENFDLLIKLTTPTTQRKMGNKTAAGCDSTIVMYLTINPIQHVDIKAVTCEGSAYHFAGKDIYLAGTYADTTTSAVSGCDSITTLYLSYDQPSTEAVDKALCNGDTYVMTDGTVISKSGNYVEHAVKASGCDSIINLHILVADESGVAHDTVFISELPYVFNGQELLGTDATIGSHDVTIPMSCGDGILRILVEDKTAVDNVYESGKGWHKAIIKGNLIIYNDDRRYSAQGSRLQ